MRVLFTTYPERTHFLLMVPLAWALRAAGHEVRCAVQPGFAGEVTRAGLTAVPVGSDRHLWQVLGRVRNWLVEGETGVPAPYDAALRPAEETGWEYLRAGYEYQVAHWHKMSNVPMVAELVEYARHWRPDLVIWEPTTYAGAIAARACGAAHGRMLVGADVFGLTRQRFRHLSRGRPAGQRVDPLAEWLAGYARRYGFEFTEDMVTGQFTIDQLPASVRIEADLPYLPMRYVPYGGPAVVPRWLRARPRRPRVIFTKGITATELKEGYPVDGRRLLDSLSDLDLELVVTISPAERDRLGPLPGNVRPVPYVPLHAVLPGCAAAIHHGGVGTLATVALNAVPQLVLPWDVDQPALAERLVAQGSALAIHAAKATGDGIRDSLLRLLRQPAFRRAAVRLRDEIRDLPTPDRLVTTLEHLATHRRHNHNG